MARDSGKKLSKAESEIQEEKIDKAGKNLTKDFQTMNKVVENLQKDLSQMDVVFTDDEKELRSAIENTARAEITEQQEKEHKSAEEIRNDAKKKEQTLREGNELSKQNLSKLEQHMHKFQNAKLGKEGLTKAIKDNKETIEETENSRKKVEKNREEFARAEKKEYDTLQKEKMKAGRYGAGVDYHQHEQDTHHFQDTHRRGD